MRPKPKHKQKRQSASVRKRLRVQKRARTQTSAPSAPAPTPAPPPVDARIAAREKILSVFRARFHTSSIRDVSKRIGVHFTHLANAMRGDRRLSYEMNTRVAAGLGMLGGELSGLLAVIYSERQAELKLQRQGQQQMAAESSAPAPDAAYALHTTT